MLNSATPATPRTVAETVGLLIRIAGDLHEDEVHEGGEKLVPGAWGSRSRRNHRTRAAG